ncbi:hypothetical protein D3C83_190060 [compost metagenome]
MSGSSARPMRSVVWAAAGASAAVVAASETASAAAARRGLNMGSLLDVRCRKKPTGIRKHAIGRGIPDWPFRIVFRS